MQQINEQQIIAMAPNSSAAANGRKISRNGGFIRLERSEDDTFYQGECKGSGKSNYITSVDFIDPDSPVCRCSCPSRQFPCKHGLALLYEIFEKKTFAACEIPEDIQRKRAKKLARDAKAQNTESVSDENESMSTEAAKKTVKKSPSKASQAAKTKKIKKQLEGLELLEKLIQNLMQTGLGTMGGAALSTYRQLSKQLGDYYLPGPQRLLNRLILEIEAFQKDSQESHYDIAMDVLKKMWTLVKKSRQYLNEKLENEAVSPDDNVLFEELGGIWKLSELENLGRCKKNVSLIQLSFWVTYDEARKEYVDTGCWVDMETGDIHMTYNYRPLKALKYVKEEDSVFEKLQISSLAYYPGEGNLRVRWDGAQYMPITEEDLKQICSFAEQDLTKEVKTAKNLLKNPLSPAMWIRLVSYEMLGNVGDDVVLRAKDGSTILLKDSSMLEGTVSRLVSLPDPDVFQNQVLLGAFYYDSASRRFQIHPLGIVTETEIVRLLY